MLFSKIARQIIALVPFVFIVMNSFLKDAGKFFFGSESRDNLASVSCLAGFYFILLLLYSLIYECLLRKLYLSASLRLKQRGERAVYQEKIDRALFTIRLKYLLTRVYRFLNLGQTTYGYPNENKVWKCLNKDPISHNIVAILKFLISIPVLTSLALSCISLRIFSLSDLSMEGARSLIIQSLTLRVDLVDLISKLPLVTTFLALVPTIFFFYFYSQKRDVRKIIDKESNKRLEESALLYENLMLWIDENLYDISNNYDYVIRVQNSIVSSRMKKRVPNYFSLTGIPPYMRNKIFNFQFIDLPEVDDFTQIVNELLSDNLDRYSRLIAYRNYDLWELYWGISSLNESEKVHRSFYTRSGVEGYISGIAELSYDINKEMFEEERKYESSILADDIYKKLKLLYTLKRGSDALRKYLYSSRMEKVLVRVLQKEKQ